MDRKAEILNIRKLLSKLDDPGFRNTNERLEVLRKILDIHIKLKEYDKRETLNND